MNKIYLSLILGIFSFSSALAQSESVTNQTETQLSQREEQNKDEYKNIITNMPEIKQILETKNSQTDNIITQLFSVCKRPKLDEQGNLYNGLNIQNFDKDVLGLVYQNGILEGNSYALINDDSKYIIPFKNGVITGSMKLYYPSGRLKADAEYKNGACVATEHYYYEKGNLWSERKCQDGTYVEMRTYYPNGKLDTIYPLNNNVAHGKALRYDEKGNLLSEVFYVNGKRQGQGKSYYPDGTLQGTITFVDDVLNGEAVDYYPNGKVFRKFAFKNAVLDGASKQYYESGRLFVKFLAKDQTISNTTFYYDETSPFVSYALIAGVVFVIVFLITYTLLKCKRASRI